MAFRGMSVPPYKGGPRSLLIWDESLDVSEHRAIELVSIKKGIGYLRPDVEGKPTSPRAIALDYLDKCVAVITEELDRQRADKKHKTRTVHMPPLDPDEAQGMINAIPDLPSTTSVLRDLLSAS